MASAIPNCSTAPLATAASWCLMTSEPCWTTSESHLMARKSSPGLLVVSQSAPIGDVVEALLIIWAVTDPSELRNQAYHLPSLINHVFPR
jgi:hypothetical protein